MFCRISEFDNMKPYICNAQLQMMPTAFLLLKRESNLVSIAISSVENIAHYS